MAEMIKIVPVLHHASKQHRGGHGKFAKKNEPVVPQNEPVIIDRKPVPLMDQIVSGGDRTVVFDPNDFPFSSGAGTAKGGGYLK